MDNDLENEVQDQRSLAEVLRRCIANCDMSINALSKATGVQQATLFWFTKGEREMNMASMQKLVDYFDLQLRHREEEIARQYDAEFVPSTKEEVVALRHEFYYAHMTSLEHDKRDLARQLREIEPELRAAGHIDQADHCCVLAARAEHHAAQLRAYIDTRLEPER